MVSYGKSPETDAQFYRELLASDLFVLGSSADNSLRESGYRRVETETKLNVRLVDYEGEPVVPAYTSVQRLTEAIPEGYYRTTGYIGLNCKTLLEIMGPGTKFAINPGHTIVKTLSPDEVKALLDGSVFKELEEAIARVASSVHPLVYPKGTGMQISYPKTIPTILMNKLTEYFQTGGDVDQAFLAEIFVPSSGQPPHLMICMSLSKNSRKKFGEICAELEPTIRSVLGTRELLDIFEITSESKHSMSKMIQFYSK